MKHKIRSMQVALDEATRQEQKAAGELGVANQLLAQQKNYLHSLFAYQKEYQGKLLTPSALRQASMIRETKGFIENLQKMIDTQKVTIQQTEQQLNQLRDHWSMRNAKMKALEQVIADYQHEIIKKEDAQEQSEQDENTQRAQYQREDVLE